MFRRKKSVHNKLLEKKLCLARETPEPVFDLADCNLLTIPHGIYSLCKVFRKELLKLENNQLSSLSGGGCLKDMENLTILDISNNCFVYLPEDISSLSNLQELYVQSNLLKQLPDSLCNLIHLKILNGSNNKLKFLPECIGNLRKLKKLHLSNNPKLKQLPDSIYKLSNLVFLELDYEEFIYPPADIVKEGIAAIMKFSDNNFEYNSPIEEDVKTTEEAQERDHFEENFNNIEKRKLKRMQEFLEIEKNNEMLQKQELEFLLSNKKTKEKLLISIVEQQDELDSKLNEIHKQKEYERFNLIEQLKETENNADLKIQKMLASNRDPSIQLLEKEREEEQKLLAAVNKYQENLNKSVILADMQAILSQETKQFEKWLEMKTETSRSILEQEFQMDSKLTSMLKNQAIQKEYFVETLRNNNNLQKVAVMTLLERGDARSWALLQQVRMVEKQLLSLTNIELQKRMLKINEQLNDLSDQRINLSALLIDLIEKQNARREHLLLTLQSIEEQNGGSEDFWLKQYQQLLEKLPEGLSQTQKNIDPKLAEILLENGCLHFLPFLAHLTQGQFSTNSISETDLIESGIVNCQDRTKILDILNLYAKLHNTSHLYAPSAPQIEIAEASAPPLEDITPINSGECVVCLEFESQIIFVPCGHLCCCFNCSELLIECPLCRAEINRKILITI